MAAGTIDHAKEPSCVTFVVGERFDSYDEVEQKLKQYEKATYTQYWKRDCRTVDAGVTKYLSHLTRYAYQFVSKQISLKDKVKIISVSDEEYRVMSSEGEIVVTPTSCHCMQWQSMRLPCRHIIAVRAQANMDIFEPSLCDKRWTMEYYKASQRVFLGNDKEESSDCSVVVYSPQKKRILSQFEKFRHVSKLTTKLASLASEAVGSEFEARCHHLQHIITSWEIGQTTSSMLNGLTKGKGCFESTNENQFQDQCDAIENVQQCDIEETQDISTQSSCLKKVTSRELMNGLTRPFPRFVALNDDIPDLSVPELQKRVIDEDIMNQGKQTHCLSDATNRDKPKLTDISLPTKLKKRGRPKGHELTVIGLPIKKRQKLNGNRVLPFIKLNTHFKQKVILEWLVSKGIATGALSDPKNLIEENCVEIKPELIHEGILDENVDIHLIRPFFTSDAWLCVTNVLQEKQKTHLYSCNCCHQDLHTFPSMGCDHCLKWIHLKCCGLKDRPKSRYWFCRSCHNSV